MFPCMTRRGCPRRELEPGAKDYCPAWFERTYDGRIILEHNVETGAQRPLAGCVFKLVMSTLHYTLAAQNSTAAEVCAMRERTADYVSTRVRNDVGDMMLEVVGRVATMLPAARENEKKAGPVLAGPSQEEGG